MTIPPAWIARVEELEKEGDELRAALEKAETALSEARAALRAVPWTGELIDALLTNGDFAVWREKHAKAIAAAREAE